MRSDGERTKHERENEMKTTFKNREYKIISKHEPSEVLKADGIVMQYVIQGARGGCRLLQEFSNGLRRTISDGCKVEIEYPKS